MNHHPTGRGARSRALAATLALCLTGLSDLALADAQTERIDELERRLEQSLRLIEQLGQKIDKLERAQGGGSPAVTQQNERIETLQQQVTQLGSGLSMRSEADLGLPMHGFADVGFTSHRQDGDRGFTVGSFDLYLAPQFTGRTKALIELLFEVDKNGNLNTDAERLQIGYTFNDTATLWGGRFHTPYGYWNLSFHHGQQIQTSILRPRFLDFEDKGGILPAHTVGLWLTGKTRLGDGRFDYDAYLGNGPRITEIVAGRGNLDPNAAGDNNHQATLGFNLGYEPNAVEGLKLGVHWMRGAVNDDSPSANRTRVNFYGPYLAHVTDDWENIAEYYRFANRDESGATGTHASWAGFVQIGRHVGSQWTAYGRLERARLDQTPLTYFALLDSGRSYRRGLIGLRYDIDPRSALKFELNGTRFTDRGVESASELRAEYSVRF